MLWSQLAIQRFNLFQLFTVYFDPCSLAINNEYAYSQLIPSSADLSGQFTMIDDIGVERKNHCVVRTDVTFFWNAGCIKAYVHIVIFVFLCGEHE